MTQKVQIRCFPVSAVPTVPTVPTQPKGVRAFVPCAILLICVAMPPYNHHRSSLERRQAPPSDNRRPGHRVGESNAFFKWGTMCAPFHRWLLWLFCRGIFLCIDFNTFPSSIAPPSIIYWTKKKRNMSGKKWRNYCWYKWFCGWCGCIRHGFRFRGRKLI